MSTIVAQFEIWLRSIDPLSPTFGMEIRSRTFPCPTFGHDAQPLMTLFSVVLPALARKPHLYVKGVWQISGFWLTVATLSGSGSKVELILEKLNTDSIDYWVQRRVFRTCPLQFLASNSNINDWWWWKLSVITSFRTAPQTPLDDEISYLSATNFWFWI